jgi:hypothetical protein
MPPNKASAQKKATPRQAARKKTAARNGIAALLAVLTATGYLLVSGALDPVLADVVSIAVNRTEKARTTEPQDGVTLNAVPITDWMYFDDRPEWSSLREIPKLPTRPDQPVEPARPVVAPPENPHHWQFTGPQPMPHYSLKPPDSCFQPRGMGLNVEHLNAIPGTKSATVTWWDLGDPDTRSYQIAIVPVGATGNPVGYTDNSIVTEPVRFLDVAAPNTCKEVSVKVTGLRTGDAYRFWLLAINQSQVQTRKYRPTRGETQTITIL